MVIGKLVRNDVTVMYNTTIWKISRRSLKFFEVVVDKILPRVLIFSKKKEMVIYRVYLAWVLFACLII
jgi:hypothetical protein